MSNVDPLFITAPEIEAALAAIKGCLTELAPGEAAPADLTEVDRRLDALEAVKPTPVDLAPVYGRLDALEQFADALKAAVAGLPDLHARLDALEAKPFLLNG